MRRDIQKIFLKWKDHPFRMPLIVRGARQVGKTYAIETFGKEAFDTVFTLNLEISTQYHACFESLEPKEILRSLELLSRQAIIPGKTLLFLDEIQQCPKALQSLRYFKERLPELHVIAAGSLLEFAIQEENFSFPVGRVQFARLYPLSFEEFLEASGDISLRQELSSFHITRPPPRALHEHLLARLQEYFVIGGMPQVMQTYLLGKSFLEARYIQKSLWDTYENDFAKYAPKTSHRHLKKVFMEAPHLIGEHIKYSRIDAELPNPAREIKRAMELLKLAGLVHPISATTAGSIPLLSGKKASIFKLLFLDIGLVQQAMDLDPQFPGNMAGPLAEQYVGQELLAAEDPLLERELFFWLRDKSSAEVDYVISRKNAVFPIEVKAGKWGKLKSLQLFLKEKKSPIGIKISSEPLEKRGNFLSLPFYLTSHLFRLVDECLP